MSQDSEANGDKSFRSYIDDFLSTAAPGLEEVVDSKSFGTMLAQTAGNLVAMQHIGHEAMDLLLRNLRVAGRSDVTSLQRQLMRTEDKLELVLETVERLDDELTAERRRNTDFSERSAKRSKTDRDSDDDV